MNNKKKLIFIPLGGCSEIGMNMYVYGYDNGKKVDYILVLGDSFDKIQKHFKKIAPKILNVETMQDAVFLSTKLSKPGHTILLSPACSSFDMFQDYQERGRIFKECVFNL